MKKESFSILFLLFFIFFAACSDDKNPDEQQGNDEKSGTSDTDNASGNGIYGDEADGRNNDFENLECGPAFGDVACDFTLPLESGEWNFAGNYSKNENYLFVFYRENNPDSRDIWTSELYNLFDKTPENTHYFFLVDTDDAGLAKEKIQVIRDSVEYAVELTEKTSVVKKIHLVEEPAAGIDSWFSEWLEKNSDFFFGIDRERKIRRGGSFSSWDSNDFPPKFKYLFKEAELYNYEYQTADFISKNSEAMKTFKGLDKIPFAEDGWIKDLFFEVDFDGLSGNGELYILLEQVCDTPKKCEWDRLERLFLCDGTGEKCETEVGRWITTYGRSGRWLTDITPLKELFAKDGKYKFKFTVDGDYYVNSLDFIFVKKEGEQPKKLIPLFNQREQFDENYNSHFEPVTVKDENVKKAEIYAFITGHGNASEQANCAEFCKFESVFSVNGNNFEIDFKNAGTNEGCFEEVKNGVVPNQYGSWPFGRAGWCPGRDVKLIKIDVTDALVSGDNTFSYAAYLNGKVYEPIVVDEDGYRAEIYLSSYLVIY